MTSIRARKTNFERSVRLMCITVLLLPLFIIPLREQLVVSLDEHKLEPSIGTLSKSPYDAKESLIEESRSKELKTGVKMRDYDTSQGYQKIAPHIMEVNSVKKNLEHHFGEDASSKELIYFVTPTYKRLTQMADLIRLSTTLDHDPALYWILAEDATHCTKRVRDLLERSGLLYAHISVLSPKKGNPDEKQARGIKLRNVALDLIESVGISGVVYLGGDDGNVYDARFFRQLRLTHSIGVFGVGFAGSGWYERCVVDDQTGRVSHFLASGKKNGKYKVDTAGVAFHTSVLWRDPRPRFAVDWKAGTLDSKFLELLVSSMDDFEPLNNCTTIYVWHTKTRLHDRKIPQRMRDDPLEREIQPVI